MVILLVAPDSKTVLTLKTPDCEMLEETVLSEVVEVSMTWFPMPLLKPTVYPLSWLAPLYTGARK